MYHAAAAASRARSELVVQNGLTTAGCCRELAVDGISFMENHVPSHFLDRFKGAMSQETGLEVPRSWPQYKRMILVRAICIDFRSVGALS